MCFSCHNTLLGGQLAQAANSRAHCAAVGGAQRVGATTHRLGARVAAPDADSLSAEGELAAEGAEVLGVLRDLKLLGALTGVGTITGAVAAHDAHLDGTLRHLSDVWLQIDTIYKSRVKRADMNKIAEFGALTQPRETRKLFALLFSLSLSRW